MPQKKKKENRGGARPGAGAKRKQFDEETTTIAFRWPVSFVTRVKALPEPNKTIYTILKNTLNADPLPDNKEAMV